MWEAAIRSPTFKLDSLCAIVDVNALGQSQPTEVARTTWRPTGARWEAFGWHAIVIDGHDMVADPRRLCIGARDSGAIHRCCSRGRSRAKACRPSRESRTGRKAFKPEDPPTVPTRSCRRKSSKNTSRSRDSAPVTARARADTRRNGAARGWKVIPVSRVPATRACVSCPSRWPASSPLAGPRRRGPKLRGS